MARNTDTITGESVEDTTVEATESTEGEKKTRQRHIPSVEDALAALTAEGPAEVDQFTVARNSLKAEVSSSITTLANEVANIAGGAEDKASLAQVLVSLKTVRSRAHKAIDSIPNEALSV